MSAGTGSHDLERAAAPGLHRPLPADLDDDALRARLSRRQRATVGSASMVLSRSHTLWMSADTKGHPSSARSRHSRMQPASPSASPSQRSAARSSTSPPSDEIRPPSKSAITLLRLTAGRLNGRRVSSVMVGVALPLLGKRNAWFRISNYVNDLGHVRHHLFTLSRINRASIDGSEPLAHMTECSSTVRSSERCLYGCLSKTCVTRLGGKTGKVNQRPKNGSRVGRIAWRSGPVLGVPDGFCGAVAARTMKCEIAGGRIGG